MSEQYVPKLGQIIAPDDNQAGRDCIHVAVAPMVASRDFEPGDEFCVLPDGTAGYSFGFHNVGIVDPFLKAPVRKGEKFWGMIFPGTIQGMRHVWRHEAFAPKLPIAMRRVEE